jgi:hypothetical protein
LVSELQHFPETSLHQFRWLVVVVVVVVVGRF